MDDSRDGIAAWREGRAGRIRLDRPAALNALDLPMVRAIAAAMEGFRDDPAVHLVVVDSAAPRAFCAGGDIRALRDDLVAGRTEAVDTFFREEYALDLAVAQFPKPWVALVDGACIGGGIGVSVHGSARVATEGAMFAMPETAIGLFPDIGASFFLPRMPGAIGFYLALTGARMKGADAVRAGFATHYVPREAMPGLAEALVRDGVAALAAHARALPPFGLAPHRAAIDRCFSAGSVPEILARLAAEDTDWARETTATLRAMSPSSLMWSHALLRAGAGRDLAACLRAELALAHAVTRHPDFLEGVRAMVVDKDRAPRWSPATVEAVDPAAIAALAG
ncbi:enoyl-CoA hydratase/isomerase family protein [Acidisphaera rubrifaciens]|uniref:3-hydroxyisobutyryl-CoA hydrolase n=1 Tax=Acidisphaera rubrifaciens HS-AP3 TaxID=1231350 RepID=A0A0D6P8G9_9PROT|nr:enoyl-CoA hydratase/isomerase family protein [Acidisphaera rubrifaciens]GAN77967.1 3-hydroxyisobutyryl-CoA hydrolase/enoyl-CoA hydratase [Acidisphaera rubrifaciens HS-AP3]